MADRKKKRAPVSREADKILTRNRVRKPDSVDEDLWGGKEEEFFYEETYWDD